MLGNAPDGGAVYRGRDASSGTTVVVRCPRIPAELLPGEVEEALDQFVDEASMLARIGQQSTDVERLVASGIAVTTSAAQVPFTVFEWLAGHSLERHIEERKGGGASIGEALIILEPAARALTVAHGLGVAHRDVRPANLWLADISGRTTLKVAAFGLATRIGRGETSYAPEYAAPEHFKKSYGAIGPATDVYGLALCIIELVTGKRALEGEDPAELYLATSDLARRPTLRARGSHVSDALEGVLQRALAVDPKRRWATARELWDALVSAVPEMTPAAPSVRLEGLGGLPPGIGRPAPSDPAGATAASAPSADDISEAAVSQRPVSLLAAPSGASLAPPAPPSEDARLSDSMRLAAAKRAEAEATARADATAVDRTGTWAWFVVAALGVVAIAVVVAKLGGANDTKEAQVPAADAGAPAETAPPVPKAAGSEETAVTVPSFSTDMIKVPAGTFTMGSDKDGRGDRPAHKVTLTRAFYIDRTEVTGEAYAKCVEAGECALNRVHSGDVVESAFGCNTAKERPRHPANCVDRMQAEKYCAFVGKRLPTEAEWEYAARGSDGREYPWGNAPPTTCSSAIILFMSGECGSHKGTWEVGTTTDGASAFGALDMAGNVWEWVADGMEAYPSGELTDPAVPLSPTGKGVLRGGSWDYAVTSAKATYRYPFASLAGNVSIGFRCARSE
ncbi:MAG: SUMF1/EgtB/PvdO family nonheme iron enzyme [Labilithrix sp.]|nr:SUMF1/EgtB/PvdO family nonheme iron enzyme [Labilithrix sp.]